MLFNINDITIYYRKMKGEDLLFNHRYLLLLESISNLRTPTSLRKLSSPYIVERTTLRYLDDMIAKDLILMNKKWRKNTFELKENGKKVLELYHLLIEKEVRKKWKNKKL